MTDSDGDAIILTVRNVRRFTEDLGKLLTTARDHLGTHGWRARTTQAIPISTSLNLSHNWIPQDAFLFVFHEKHPKVLGIVSVVFDSVERPDLFTVPLVMVGYVRFAVPVTNSNYVFGWSRLCDGTSLPPDGSFQNVPMKNLGKIPDVQNAEIAARPLSSITSSDLLATHIIDPLLLKLNSLLTQSTDVPPT